MPLIQFNASFNHG